MTTPVPVPFGRRADPVSVPVALIRPPVVVLPSSLATHGPTPPIGLAYIASTLRSAGHTVRLIDAPGEAIEQVADIDTPVGTLHRLGLTPQEIVDRVPADARVIGVSLMFVHEWPQTRELLAELRGRFPDAVIMLGGETATSFWPWMFRETDAIDLVVTGEGEATALEIVERVGAGTPLDGLEGVVLRAPDGTALSDGGLPTRMRKLDAVPRPAWDLVPLAEYWRHPFFGVNRGRSMPVLATRGCPYRCSFCSSPQMWTTRYVVREPDDVADEIAAHVREHGVRNVNFCDLTAITKRNWTLRFCDALEARDLDITWQLPVGTRAEALDAEVLQRLYDTGCRNVTYAPESGSDRMLEVYDKKVKLPHILESLRAANRVGLKTHVNIIIGHPEERWGDVLRSVVFMLRAAWAGCDDSAAIIFCPYPGSADFQRLVESGELTVDESTCYIGLTRSSSVARSFNPVMSAQQLRVLQLAMLAIFYGATFVLHPTRLVHFVRAQVTGREATYLDQMVRSRRRARRPRPTPGSADGIAA